jgi:hypothetical protein
MRLRPKLINALVAMQQVRDYENCYFHFNYYEGTLKSVATGLPLYVVS